MKFLLRWLFAFLLLAVTFNPTQWNYVRWTRAHWGEMTSVIVLSGLVLLIGYVIYLRATFRSIGTFGILLVAALFGSFLWVAYDFGLLDLDNAGLNTWLTIFVLSLVLGIGLSWSLVRRSLTGQADVDDVDE